MKGLKIYPVLLFLILIAGCSNDDTITDLTRKTNGEHYSLIKLEYTIKGGYAGTNLKITVSGTGEAVCRVFGSPEFIINAKLSQEQLDSLDIVFMKNEIYNMEESYKPEHQVMDGIDVSFNYSSTYTSKNISIEGGSKLPDKLDEFIGRLFEINYFVSNNPDYYTLLGVWGKPDDIVQWPFPEIELHVKNYFYDEISNADEVLKFFEKLRGTVGYQTIFWDGDSLYDVYNGGLDYGYMNVHQGYPVKYWETEFNYEIPKMYEKGITLPADEWVKRDIKSDEYYLYVIDKLVNNGKAIRVKLVPGRPVE